MENILGENRVCTVLATLKVNLLWATLIFNRVWTLFDALALLMLLGGQSRTMLLQLLQSVLWSECSVFDSSSLWKSPCWGNNTPLCLSNCVILGICGNDTRTGLKIDVKAAFRNPREILLNTTLGKMHQSLTPWK